MNHFAPVEYETRESLMDNKTQLHGNVEIIGLLKKIARKLTETVNLYEAQDLIKEYCLEAFSSEFYDESAEAINFIVENEYCHIERNSAPLKTDFFYKKDQGWVY